ncbi:Globin-like protein [Pseudocohnilembus persalinus]|uniref:Globin-like protein n=1 Tax=Pseudocohnilembus persalinus TaxID=266149 RepID=A0A0V0QDK7_PSEPJ|nr:Globin-like protein [Pseudocohnilembus persalinus]|eukprot:KRX00286.1 Globin-like protein [Pseudocohnilembus persalinus]
MNKLQKKLRDFFVRITGGVDNYKGKGIKQIHQNLEIKISEYEAFVKIIYQCLKNAGFKKEVVDQFLQKLAEYKEDIVFDYNVESTVDSSFHTDQDDVVFINH